MTLLLWKHSLSKIIYLKPAQWIRDLEHLFSKQHTKVINCLRGKGKRTPINQDMV